MSDIENSKTLEDEKPKVNETEFISPFAGIESVQGLRKTMEDTHVMIEDLSKQYPEVKNHISFYGVYDGHGGIAVAKQCAEILHVNIIKDPAFQKGDIETAIINGFLETDKQLASSGNHNHCGATAVIALIVDDDIYVANVGDSEAVLGRKVKDEYEAILLSQKHKPTDSTEKTRIQTAGGHVVFNRVMGTLAVSRALGDFELKSPINRSKENFVLAEPFIQKVKLLSENDFLIISCDGLWDKLSYKEAVHFVVESRQSGKTATEIAQLLVQDSLDKGSLDNITTIVIFFPSKRTTNHVTPQRKRKASDEGESSAESPSKKDLSKNELST